VRPDLPLRRQVGHEAKQIEAAGCRGPNYAAVKKNHEQHAGLDVEIVLLRLLLLDLSL